MRGRGEKETDRFKKKKRGGGGGNKKGAREARERG